MLRLGILTMLVVIPVISFSQSAVLSAGGDASGTGGSISYSIGQVFYTHTDGTAGTIHEGVQQPYEFFAVSVDEVHAALRLNVFPNPTTQMLILQAESLTPGLTAHIYDSSGQLIFESLLSSNSLTIDAQSWAAATYVLRITDLSGGTSHYKIVKQ
jgi:Secretion system C-terminal sorting domain